ncbi:MAG: serine/threonine-protein kinase, partial [Planctomycetota bacterium]|nr:serine/threonine-protein kinase [Planctomycetota bacterium]
MDPLRNDQILVLLIQRKDLMDSQALQDSLEESKRQGIPLLHNLLDRKVLQENSLENLRKEAKELALVYESTMEIDTRQPPIKQNPEPPDLVAIFDTSHSDLETSIESRTDGLPLDAPPKEFGNYELESEIGRGGMGIVFRGRDKKLGRSVAIKVMNPPPGLTKEERRNAFHRFEREASLTSQLTHPNIVPIFESGQQDGFHFITMAFIQGESLSSLMKQKRFSPMEAAELIEPICRALAHAHSQGVIHRDIKPSNILVDQSGTPYLVDFGLVRSISNLTDLTVTGIILGTPRYMSPEQAAGEKDELGPRSDLYSVGVVLYELVTGTPPFKAKSILELLSLIANYPCPDPKVKIPSLPEEMRTILLTAIAKDPADRYPGTRAMADDLKRFREGSPIKTSPPPPPTTTTPIHPTRITRLPFVVGTVSLFVAIVFATLFFTSPPPKQPATVDPLQTLIFGVHPFTEKKAIEKGYGTLIDHLSKACDTSIELVICPNYEEVVARITQGEGGIHLALLSGYNYVQAHSREPDLKPLAQQVRGGQAFYHGVIITQQDSSIRTLEDLRGKRFAFVDPNSTSGYVFPRSLIRTQGKDPDDFFREILFFRSHDKVLQAVREGKQVDAGAVFEGALDEAPEVLRAELRRLDKLRTDP